jgi:tRNA-Thr(GGU) m(6)t(6)A37 methyltransferase TsaA
VSGPLIVEPIGVFRSPFREPAEAPRQTRLGLGVKGRIELLSGKGFEFALSDLERWSHLWVLFWFHRAEGWRPKVRPPRSRTRRGVFATRSPHRPNPIGLSAVALERVEGLTLWVDGVDVLDGTPVLDLKPYVAYCDSISQASDGWLGDFAREDTGPRWEVELAPFAREQAAYLAERWNIALAEPIARALSLGPAPHPYRRIKRDGDALRLAHKDWRARFSVDGEHVQVLALATGYRAAELFASDAPELAAHRDFVRVFGYPGDQGEQTAAAHRATNADPG